MVSACRAALDPVGTRCGVKGRAPRAVVVQLVEGPVPGERVGRGALGRSTSAATDAGAARVVTQARWCRLALARLAWSASAAVSRESVARLRVHDGAPCASGSP